MNEICFTIGTASVIPRYRDDSSGDLMDAMLPLRVRRTVAVDEVFASFS